MSAVLMTGVPGFIGTRLIRDLLARPAYDGRFFYFLCESTQLFKAKATLEAMEREHASFQGRWQIVEGDITRPMLGLSTAQATVLHDAVTEVWHLAALYDLAAPLPRAYRINVDGTQHVIAFCRQCKTFDRLFHISTAYVSGWRAGTVFEDELDRGQTFKNHYESTKCWSEKLVAHVRDELPVTVFRPAIVVGDSRTGEAAKADGPYYLMHLLLRLPSWLPMAHVGSSKAHVNLVPVDWLVGAMGALATLEQSRGETYHLADASPLRADQIVELMVSEMGRAPIIATLPESLAQRALRVPQLARLVGIPREALDYFNHDVVYDTSNTRRALAEHVAPCPSLASYLPRLIDYAERTPSIFAGRAA